ncbi:MULTISPECIES: nuclear transport factor 2 family protein [Pedobacter]|uniref:nuclear transport factor 2 family protein n=1 Tax=Pedobacter TaxID=84567 RepID=UPI00120004E2|nr:MULTISPECIES: nuclear transport factor 2 family protein [Pedobacter]RZL62380.1 MAG: nuclear transport factor 2 family protein [Pedobacter sp.]
MMDTIITTDNILALENELYGAIKDRNVKLLDELLHDDLLFIVPSGEIITKNMDIDSYREDNLRINELLPKTENLNIIGDTAVITVVLLLKGEYNKIPFEAKYRYIRFWKQLKDGIKVIGGSGIAIND